MIKRRKGAKQETEFTLQLGIMSLTINQGWRQKGSHLLSPGHLEAGPKASRILASHRKF